MTWDLEVAGCFAIISLMVGAAIYRWIDHPRIVWLGFMAIVGIGAYYTHQFVSFLQDGQQSKAAHNQTPLPSTPIKHDDSSEKILKPASQPAPKPISLRRLFETDLPGYSGTSTAHSMSSPKDGSAVTLPLRIIEDLRAKNRFMAFFIPHSPDSHEICLRLARECHDINSRRDDIGGTFTDLYGASSKDLKFSGRVFIYHEDIWSIPQLSLLDAEFRKNNLDPQFRDRKYLILRETSGQVI